MAFKSQFACEYPSRFVIILALLIPNLEIVGSSLVCIHRTNFLDALVIFFSKFYVNISKFGYLLLSATTPTTSTATTTTTTTPSTPTTTFFDPCEFYDDMALLNKLKQNGLFNSVYMAPDVYTAAKTFPDLGN